MKRLLAVGLAVLAVLAVTAGTGAGAARSPGPPSPGPGTPELVLTNRQDAVLAGDRAGFMATVDPSAPPGFLLRQRRLFDGLRSIRFSKYELRLRTDQVPDLSAGLASRYGVAPADVVLPLVESRYRIAGVDTSDALDFYYYTFVRRGGVWRIASDTDVDDVGLPSARNLWDYGPVSSVRSAHFVVYHDAADAARARFLDGLCERAYARLAGSFGRPVPALITVVLPHSLDQLRDILQATFDLTNFVAFAAATVDRDRDWAYTAARVYVQDTNLSRSSPEQTIETFTHEFTHVASFPYAGPFDPSWVHEGLADWMAYGRRGPAPVEGGDPLLPDDYRFTTGSSAAIVKAYEEATSAMGFLAKRKGMAAPVDLLVGIGADRLDAGTPAYHVDQTMRRLYGAPFPQFEKDWNDGHS